MPERFPDMVLSVEMCEVLIGKSLYHLAGHAKISSTIAEAQHEADMAHEGACPCVCHGDGSQECVEVDSAWHSVDLHPERCGVCSGTGRVTIGALVAADMAKKATKTAGEGLA